MKSNLQDFVNRERVIAAYEEICEASKPQILLVHGVAGIGKTFLLSYLHENRVGHPAHVIQLDFRSSPNLSQVTDLIDSLRDQCDDEFDEQLSMAELSLTQGLNARSVSDKLTKSVEETLTHTVTSSINQLSLAGDIDAQDIFIGNKIVISNSKLILNPEKGQGLLDKEISRQRSRALRSALLSLAERHNVYLFIDHCDEAPEEMLDWFLRQILVYILQKIDECRIKKSDKTYGIFIVVACRDASALLKAGILREIMRPVELLAFSDEVSVRFWTMIRRLDEQLAVAMARASAGHPGTLALMASNFANSRKTVSEHAK